MRQRRIIMTAATPLALAAFAVSVAISQLAAAPDVGATSGVSPDVQPGEVSCANLIYAYNKTSVCFADEFLSQLRKDTRIRTNRRFHPVKLDSDELFMFPFAVMTGEGSFNLTEQQRANLRAYLTRGGFLVASAGCSSKAWDASFRSEIERIFPDLELKPVPMSHSIFHIVYDINSLQTKQPADAVLYSLEYDDRIVMIYSPEGLNDTSQAGPGCCCCGANEILNARQVNANLLAYALTH